MVEGGGGVAFPVVLFDGEREINVGDVRIYPTLDFKTFQMMLSQMIGVSPNQITVYLVSSKKQKSSSPDNRWKIPITGKANFAVIAREKDCFILAVLKRSRKSRKQKTREGGLDVAEYLPENSRPSSPPAPAPEKFLLLRRNQPDFYNLQHSDFSMPYYNQISQSEILNFNNRLHNLQIQRENHEMAMSRLNSQMNTQPSLDLNSFPRIEDSFPISKPPPSVAMAKNDRATCVDCANAKQSGETAPFHHCVNDPVIRWFRTAAGPIGRRRWGP